MRGRQEPTCLDLLRVGTKQPTTSGSAEGARAHGKRPSRMEGLKGISPSMRSVRTFSSSNDSHHDRAASVRTLATQYGKKAKLKRGMESGPTGSTPIDKHLRADLHAEEAHMGDVESPCASTGVRSGADPFTQDVLMSDSIASLRVYPWLPSQCCMATICRTRNASSKPAMPSSA